MSARVGKALVHPQDPASTQRLEYLCRSLSLHRKLWQYIAIPPLQDRNRRVGHIEKESWHRIGYLYSESTSGCGSTSMQEVGIHEHHVCEYVGALPAATKNAVDLDKEDLSCAPVSGRMHAT